MYLWNAKEEIHLITDVTPQGIATTHVYAQIDAPTPRSSDLGTS